MLRPQQPHRINEDDPLGCKPRYWQPQELPPHHSRCLQALLSFPDQVVRIHGMLLGGIKGPGVVETTTRVRAGQRFTTSAFSIPTDMVITIGPRDVAPSPQLLYLPARYWTGGSPKRHYHLTVTTPPQPKTNTLTQSSTMRQAPILGPTPARSRLW